ACHRVRTKPHQPDDGPAGGATSPESAGASPMRNTPDATRVGVCVCVPPPGRILQRIGDYWFATTGTIITRHRQVGSVSFRADSGCASSLATTRGNSSGAAVTLGMDSITEWHLKLEPADVKFQPGPPAVAIASIRWPAFLHEAQRREKHGKFVCS